MSNEDFIKTLNQGDLDLLENDLKTLFSGKINSETEVEILNNPDQKERILGWWDAARVSGIKDKLLGEEQELTGLREVVNNYLKNKKQAGVLPPEQAKHRVDFLKKILSRNQHPSVLELPEMVDLLVRLHLSENEAIDLVKETFGQELGIEDIELASYLKEIRSIDKYVDKQNINTNQKIDLKMFMKNNVLPSVIKAKTIAKNTSSKEVAEVITRVTAPTSLNSDPIYQTIVNYPYKDFYEQSVQTMFLNKHSDSSQITSIFQSFADYGIGKVKDKATKAIVQKFVTSEVGGQILTSLGIKIAASEGAAIIGGAAVGGPVGFAIGVVVTEVVSKIKDAASLFQRFVKKSPEVFGAITVGASFIPFGLSPILGGFIGFSGGLIVKNGVGAAGETIATGFNRFSSGLVDAVGTEIVWPIVVIIITTPIVIALILFIITNSALVVPYDSSDGYYGGNPAFSTVAGSCPLESGIPSCFSYESNQSCRHGSDSYWLAQGVACRGDANSICKKNEAGKNIEMCLFEVPYVPGVCRYSSNPSNTCYQSGNTCSGYGRALDVSAKSGTPVFLPEINSKKLDWQFVSEISINSGLWGYGKTFTASDESNTYELYLGHLNKGGSGPGTSGKNVGSLHCINDCNQAHVHIELKINGINVVPDGLCKN